MFILTCMDVLGTCSGDMWGRGYFISTYLKGDLTFLWKIHEYEYFIKTLRLITIVHF